jgi:hypothetical protein
VYAVGRYARGRAPGEWNPGACGVAAAGDDWEARLVAIWGGLKTKLPNADFEIAPWIVSGGRVMFVLTAHVAIASRQQRAAGVKRHGGRVARATRTARRAAEQRAAPATAPAPDAPADAGTEELVVPSPVADVAAGVAAASAGAAPDNAPAAEVARLSQTLQVSPPALPLHALSFDDLCEYWAFIPGKHSRSSDERSSGDDDGKRYRLA